MKILVPYARKWLLHCIRGATVGRAVDDPDRDAVITAFTLLDNDEDHLVEFVLHS